MDRPKAERWQSGIRCLLVAHLLNQQHIYRDHTILQVVLESGSIGLPQLQDGTSRREMVSSVVFSLIRNLVGVSYRRHCLFEKWRL